MTSIRKIEYRVYLSVAREIEASVRTCRGLAKSDARHGAYSSAADWKSRAELLSGWAEHFRGKALRVKAAG